ncbi:uncharacterized protein LOC125666678 isoform X2 [Ostrea edulis]|nr:uncharacterized protein LOC125666678 isoform X2 [Ostrea edulis]
MKGEVKCGFEGNQDVCFDQDKSDNFDWEITRNGRTPRYPSTGPENNIEGNYFTFIDVIDRQKGHRAVLISKFELNNVNITFSMYYNMNGRHVNTLRVYLKKTKTAEKTEIIKESGNQGRSWMFFNRTVVLDGKTRLYISATVGNGSFGNIAIDDIRIKINRPELKYNWMDLNKRCQDMLGGYPVNHKQLANMHCLSPGPERWTSIIRPQRRSTATEVVQHYPTVVKLFQGRVDPYSFVWDTFNTSVSRPFVCEKDSSNTSCSLFSEDSTTLVSVEAGTSTEMSNAVTVWVVPACVLMLGVVIALLVISYRRKGIRCRKHDDLSGAEVTYPNVTPSTQIVSTEKKPKTVSIPEYTDPSSGAILAPACYDDVITEKMEPACYDDVITEKMEPACYDDVITEKMAPACYDDVITEKMAPACYDDVITEKMEPACYDDVITEKMEPACYDDVITEKMAPACYDDVITEKMEPACYEGLIMKKMEPACYEGLITKK